MIKQFHELYSNAMKELEDLEKAYTNESKMLTAAMASYSSCHNMDDYLKDETADMIDDNFDEFKTHHLDYLDSIEFIDANVKSVEEDLLAEGYDLSEEDHQISSQYEQLHSKLLRDAKATYKMIESMKNRAIASLS